MLVHLRGQHVEAKETRSRVPTPEAVAMAAAAWTMQDPKRYGRAQKASRAGRLLARGRERITTLPAPLSAWTAARDLPVPPRQTFREWWATERGADDGADRPGPSAGNRP